MSSRKGVPDFGGILPTMRAQHGGQIVMISSEGGLEYYDGLGGYAVAKSALNFLAELIQRENQELGIRVHTLLSACIPARTMAMWFREGALGEWAMTCRGGSSKALGIARYTVFGGMVDP